MYEFCGITCLGGVSGSSCASREILIRYLSTLNHLFTIIAVSETWETTLNAMHFHIPGYAIVSVPKVMIISVKVVVLHCMFVTT